MDIPNENFPTPPNLSSKPFRVPYSPLEVPRLDLPPTIRNSDICKRVFFGDAFLLFATNIILVLVVTVAGWGLNTH